MYYKGAVYWGKYITLSATHILILVNNTVCVTWRLLGGVSGFKITSHFYDYVGYWLALICNYVSLLGFNEPPFTAAYGGKRSVINYFISFNKHFILFGCLENVSVYFQVCRNPIVEDWQKVYVIILTVLFFLLPSIFLFALNFHLFRVLHVTREYETCIHENRRERRRKQNQVANIILSIVSIFFICHLPFRVAVLWFTFEDKNKIWALGLERYLLILYSTRIMFYLNHALNPVIYNFVSTKFRGALYEVYLSVRRFGCCSFFTRYKQGLRGSVVFSTKTIISRQRQSSSDV